MPSLPIDNNSEQKKYNSNLTTSNINNNLIKLAWPQIGESLFWFAMTFVDLIWIGKLGLESVAILGTGQIITFFFFSLRSGIDTATRALISRALGQNQTNYANAILLQSIFIAIAYSLIVILFIRTLLESTLTAINFDTELIPHILIFMTIQGFSLMFISIQSVCSATIQSSGNSITPAKIEIGTRIIHIILSPVLIFGLLYFPKLGVYGIPITMLITRVLASLLILKIIKSQNSIFSINVKDFTFNQNIIKQLIKIAIPSSLIQLQRGLLQIVFLSIMATQGATSISVYTVMRRLELLFIVTSTRLGSATGIIVGHNLAINQTKISKTAINLALIYMFLGGILTTILISIFAYQISGIIGKDPNFIRITSMSLITISLGCISIGGSNLLTTIISSAGKPNIPILISIISAIIIEVPVAVILGQILNIKYFSELAIPIAIISAATIRLIIIWVYEKSNRWIQTGLL